MNNEFDLQRAIAGEPIETISGTPVEFVAYRPNVKWSKQLIVEVGTDICTYHANGRYHNSDTSYSYDLRMKPNLKQINWAKLPVDTLLTIDLCTGREKRYFQSFSYGMVRYYYFGATSKTVDSNLGIFAISSSNVKIAPDQPWTVWQGGVCPIPDGLEYEVLTRGGAAPLNNRGSYHVILWSYVQSATHSMSEIIAYRLTGKVLDGWTL
jgi:hypothetical protein